MALKNFPYNKFPGFTNKIKNSYGINKKGEISKNKEILSSITNIKDKDVIGVGINYYSKRIFFTKNGLLSSVFDNVPLKNYYPTIGVKGYGCCIKFNFGKSKFLYNINNQVDELNKMIQNEIYQNKIENDYNILNEDYENNEEIKYNKEEIITNLMINYFFINGYKNTFKTFLNEIDHNGNLNEICNNINHIQNTEKLINLRKKTRGESIFLEPDTNLSTLPNTNNINNILDILNSILIRNLY